MIRLTRLRTASLPVLIRGIAAVALVVGALTSTGGAQQLRSVTDGVYSAAQAGRGQQIYQTQCVACHGATLDGAVGPPLAGDAFLGVWSARPLADIVDKVEKTMPPQAAGSISRQQATDIAAYLLQVGKFPSGQADLAVTTLAQVAFPARARAGAAAGAATALAPTGNLAQVMRGITFPNANILFNVQVKDPAAQKPEMPVPFDYVQWGTTVYYGWQSVDQAALALIETAPLFLVPGRRCENGRPVPVDKADWKQFTAALVDVGRAAFKASQSRSMDAVVDVATRLNDACANCHKVYRDGTTEGQGRGSTRCQ